MIHLLFVCSVDFELVWFVGRNAGILYTRTASRSSQIADGTQGKIHTQFSIELVVIFVGDVKFVNIQEHKLRISKLHGVQVYSSTFHIQDKLRSQSRNLIMFCCVLGEIRRKKTEVVRRRLGAVPHNRRPTALLRKEDQETVNTHTYYCLLACPHSQQFIFLIIVDVDV